MIAGHFCSHQSIAITFTCREFLAHFCLFIIRNARRHWACRQKDRGDKSKCCRRNDQTRNNLVTHTQIQRGIECVVRKRDRRGQCDGIARKQRQFHARLALGDAITHGGHTACHLGGATMFAGNITDERGIGFIGLMRGQHVIICRHDPHIWCPRRCQCIFVRAHRSIGMRLVPTCQMRTARSCLDGFSHFVQILATSSVRPLNNPISHAGKCWM